MSCFVLLAPLPFVPLVFGPASCFLPSPPFEILIFKFEILIRRYPKLVQLEKTPLALVATTTPLSSWASAAKFRACATPLQGNAFYFSITRKSSSRTNCPYPAHPASRIFPADRGTLIHGARRQIETQNKKQLSPRTSVPPRYPIPCPSLPTLLASPKMTINLALSCRPPLLSHNRSGALKRRTCAVFLIANTRLEFRSSQRKLSPLKFPNREPIAIRRRAFSRLTSFEPQPPSLQNPFPPYDGRLIANLELRLHLTGRGTNHMQISNRKFSTVFTSTSSSAPRIACCSTQVVLIYGGAIKTPRNTFKICSIRISNRR